MWQPTGNAAKPRANSLNRELEKMRGCGCSQHGYDGTGDAGRNLAANNNDCNGDESERSSLQRPGREAVGDGFHPPPEFARYFLQPKTKKIFDLRAGDEHRNAVRKTNDDRSRNEFYRRAHSC